jgi:hypothetical protein
MHPVVDEQLKDDVQDDPHAKQRADGRRSVSQQFPSTFSIEEETEQVRRISRLGISETPSHPGQAGERRLQDEAEAFGSREPLRQSLQELP